MAVSWEILEDACLKCTQCSLCETRTHVVIGRGNRDASVLFVGEGPGRQEDEQGIPFVGQAGQLLDLALVGLGFREDDYYIANVVKCRPPENRTPLENECKACIGYLRAQFALIQPKIVVCLGNVALKYLMDPGSGISKIRGQWFLKKDVFFTATYHPAALLRDEGKKLEFWQDLRAVRDKLQEIQREARSK